MEKQTKLILGLAAIGAGVYLFWKQSKKTNYTGVDGRRNFGSRSSTSLGSAGSAGRSPLSAGAGRAIRPRFDLSLGRTLHENGFQEW